MRVVFDIGHGTDTMGKGVGTFREHSFNSAVALKAMELAVKQGFEVLLSQQPNSPEVKLGSRCEWVNGEHKKNPILCLISFHANAAANTKATGWGVFHWYNSAKGQQLAELWANHASILPIKQWGQGIWQCKPGEWTNFDIVRKPVMPCLLIEHFFFTNPEELKKCTTPEMINLFAEVTVRALCEFAGLPYKEHSKENGKLLIEEIESLKTENKRLQGIIENIRQLTTPP
jgi:N-acetylmuramoyl-L-alanine amidase